MSDKTCELSVDVLYDIRRSVVAAMRFEMSGEQMEKLRQITALLDGMCKNSHKLKNNCSICRHPWRKNVGEVYCYEKNDEYHEHACVIENPELKTCCNFKSSRKTGGFCEYQYGCGFKAGDKCTNTAYCPQQTRKRPNKCSC